MGQEVRAEFFQPLLGFVPDAVGIVCGHLPDIVTGCHACNEKTDSFAL
jgi:hypothetical protein